MKHNVNFYNFNRAFHDMGRGDSFSYEGLKALFNYKTLYQMLYTTLKYH